METQFGLANVWSQGDIVTRSVAILLLVMSLASWIVILTKALDLRGMLDALRLIRRGVPAGAALDMGITNKAFDSYEQGLIRDVIAARIPAQLTAAKLFR